MVREIYAYEEGAWDITPNAALDSEQTLVIVFGASEKKKIEEGLKELFLLFPRAIKIGCSTAGEIYQEELHEESLSVAVMRFDTTPIKVSTVEVRDAEASAEAGRKLARELAAEDLSSDVSVTGGLAGDGTRFEKTWILCGEEIRERRVVGVGFYGDHIHVLHASKGGWNKFGIDRIVTRSKANILYELDGRPALELYKTYLGEYAADLPSSGLLFPLVLKEEGEEKVRTILGVDEEAQSITFAGDIPQGATVALMRANLENLIEGASEAAESIAKNPFGDRQVLVVAISCVGRKLVLGQRTEDEIESILEILDGNMRQIGFYSYGEISPLSSGKCDLHNQTMTLTLWWES
ncbi:MAG: hypothetical protein B6D59_01355 [Campylobacteraceae bacterium 4484_4]|nr:MAG: hypothetical protein B6D59_01355 [Campylobacteraceae bacterium 4484_4]